MVRKPLRDRARWTCRSARSMSPRHTAHPAGRSKNIIWTHFSYQTSQPGREDKDTIEHYFVQPKIQRRRDLQRRSRRSFWSLGLPPFYP